MLCHRSSREGSRIGPVLIIYTDHTDVVRGIHGTDFIEDDGADEGETLEDSFVVVVNFHGYVFSGPCRLEKGRVVVIAGDGGSVQGVGDGLALGERGERLRE